MHGRFLNVDMETVNLMAVISNRAHTLECRQQLSSAPYNAPRKWCTQNQHERMKYTNPN